MSESSEYESSEDELSEVELSEDELETAAAGCAVLALLRAGSWPETSWKKIAAQTIANVARAPAMVDRRIRDTRCRRSACLDFVASGVEPGVMTTKSGRAACEQPEPTLRVLREAAGQSPALLPAC